jgi:hypothetical protein
VAEAADKPTPIPSLLLDWREWAPLDEAFVRIKARVGTRDLALHDLFRDLSTPGRLGSAERILPYRDTSLSWNALPYHSKEPLSRALPSTPRVSFVSCINVVLAPSEWAGYKLLDVIGHPDRVRVYPPTGRFLHGQHFFFVRRADLDRLYPLSEPQTALSPEQVPIAKIEAEKPQPSSLEPGKPVVDDVPAHKPKPPPPRKGKAWDLLLALLREHPKPSDASDSAHAEWLAEKQDSKRSKLISAKTFKNLMPEAKRALEEEARDEVRRKSIPRDTHPKKVSRGMVPGKSGEA